MILSEKAVYSGQKASETCQLKSNSPPPPNKKKINFPGPQRGLILKYIPHNQTFNQLSFYFEIFDDT